MAQIVKLRRSSVSGQKPTNSNLQLGELALNTTDGKVFMAVSGAFGPSVEELISTNTVNTGSINLIGDVTASIFTGSFKGDGSQLYNIPLSGVTNLVSVSGSIDSRLDVLEAYSGSQLVPSSSMSFRTLQTDVYCKNVTGVQINKGTVVRIVGSTGDNPLIAPADLLTEGQSANTLGIAIQDIPNDGWGLIITEGILTGVNTNGMTAGALLFLGVNGTFTTTAPTAPNHGVRLGEVLRVQQNNGSIYVRIDNGSELNEAHDVIYSNISHGDLLFRSGSVWKNSKNLEGDYKLTGSLTITQNLTVLGSSSLVYVTSSNLSVSASFISVNVFEPAERFGGLKVYDSGSSNATASLAWDSQHNHWVYQNVSGSNYSGGMLLSGPRNSGSLGDEPGLINGRIVKSIGGDHLDVSIISETGSTITINGNLVADSITGSFDFFGLINRPTLVSGSSQIEITGTTGYSTFSSSIATTTNELDGRLDSIEGVTGSYATTGSNLFKGDQTISGSVIIGSGSLDSISPEILHVENSGSYNIAHFDGNHIGYAQINVQNHNSGSSASGDIVVTADNGTENIHYVDLGINSSNYNAGYVGYANDAYLINAGKDLYVGTIGGILHPSNVNLFTQNHWQSPQIHISGSKQVGFNTTTITDGYQYEFSGSIKANNELNVIGGVSSSIFTGSYIGDGFGLYNIPASGVTGLELNKIVDGSVSASISNGALRVNSDVFIDGILTANELHIDYVTSSVLYQSGSTKFGDTADDNHNFTGSVYIDGNLNVDSITGSIDFNNLTNVPTLVSGSSQIIDLGFTTTSSFQSFTSSYIGHSSSFDVRINNITGSLDDLTGSFESFTSSVVLTSQTGSMTVLSASYAATAAFALNAAGAGVEGKSAKLTQSISSSTWTFDHFLGEKYPNVTVYDSNDQIVVPTYIEAISDTQLVIYFSIAQTGTAVATIGGGLPAISGSYEGRVLSVVDGAGSWKEGIVSSSLQIVEAGFATTGSNTFLGDQTISGTLSVLDSVIKHETTPTITVGTHNITSIATSLYDAAFFDYVVKDGTNMRAGTVMSVTNGTIVKYNEASTNDIGDTTPVELSVTIANGNINLVATISSGTWTFSSLIRGI